MKKFAARWFLRCVKWRIDPARPTSRKWVLIAAPHTSAWDLPYMLAIAWAIDQEIAWLGKHQLFRWPFGRLMRWLGGLPVRRDRSERRVSQLVELMNRSEQLALVIPPEATRARAESWRSGFYHVAVGAKVPIVMGYLDFAHRIGGFGPELHPSGDLRRDMDAIRAFYADKVGRRPERSGAIRLAEEGD